MAYFFGPPCREAIEFQSSMLGHAALYHHSTMPIKTLLKGFPSFTCCVNIEVVNDKNLYSCMCLSILSHDEHRGRQQQYEKNSDFKNVT